MLYRKLLMVALLVALGWAGPARGLAAVTYQPEVLLMRSVRDGAEKSFSHAKLKPITPEGRPLSAAFRYRAEEDTVTCTVKPAAPNAAGVIMTTVEIQREAVDAEGHKSVTTTSQQYAFTPGKSLIVATAPHAQENFRDNTVEILQLTLLK